MRGKKIAKIDDIGRVCVVIELLLSAIWVSMSLILFHFFKSWFKIQQDSF